MSAGLQAVREELRVLARIHRAGADCKGLCLALIDHAASSASNRHGEIPDDVLGYLMRAMHAAGRDDVAGVIEEVEAAVALLGGDGPRSVQAERSKPKPLAQSIDPLLAKLRAKVSTKK